VKHLNEFNAIEALLGTVPHILGCNYSQSGSPDEMDSTNKEVDFLLVPDEVGFPNLAVEHTVVEAFRGQRTYLQKSYEIVQTVDRKCKGLLAMDRFFGLVLLPNLVEKLRRKELNRFVDTIAPWVIDTAKTLAIDDYKITKYAEYEVVLLCSGSLDEANGTVGRMPGSPKNQKELVADSLWLSVEHGVAKFAKYKQLGYTCVLALENVSGLAHPSLLADFRNDPYKRSMIELIDYVIVFASNEDRMIVGSVWKEKTTVHVQVPFSRRFHKVQSKWTPFE